MRHVCWILLALPMLLGVLSCSRQERDTEVALSEKISKMPPAEGYAAALAALRENPGKNGLLYRTAYHHAIGSDSIGHYAHFLDSIEGVAESSPNRFYTATYRAMCAYLLKSPDLDSLVNAAAGVAPGPDAMQEKICAHLTARLLSEHDLRKAYTLQKRAIAALRKGVTGSTAEVLAQAAELACDLGDYHSSMDLLNEAQDTLAAHGWPARDAAFVLGNKANLYSNVEMYDSALSSNRRALEMASDNNYQRTDLLIFRGFIFSNQGQTDSALVCLESAARMVEQMPPHYADVWKKYIPSRHALLTVKTGGDRQAMRKAAEALSAYIQDSPGLWEEKLALGYAQWQNGDAAGLTLMEQMRDTLAGAGEPELLLRADRHLISAYSRTGRLADAARLYDETFALTDTLDLRHVRMQAIAADLQYRVTEHQRENTALKEQISHERERVVWLSVAGALAALLLAWTVVYIFLSRRLHQRQRAVDSRQITSLIENQKMLNRYIEQLQTHADAGNESGSAPQALQPSLMSADDTNRFRQSFTALYPDFLPRLRNCYPDVTTSDENLCMLIKMGQNSEEIALALGISRASVYSARYRIRKKFSMDNDASLNELISTL